MKLFLFIIALILPAFTAQARTIPSPEDPRCKKDNLYEKYFCSTCGAKENTENGDWAKAAKEKCQKEVCDPKSFNTIGRTVEQCFADCMRIKNFFRVGVCANCGAPVAAQPNPPAEPKPTSRPTPPLLPKPLEEDRDTADAGDGARRPTRGEGRGARREACQDHEDCYRRGAEAQRQAEEEARAKRIEAWRAMREARGSKESTISSATEILNNWQRKIESEPRTSAKERAQFQSDQRLVQRAKAASQSKGKFTEADALEANDPGIMRELAMHVESRELEHDLGEDHTRFQVEENKFHQMAATTNERAQQIGSVLAVPAKKEGAARVVSEHFKDVSTVPVGGAKATSGIHLAEPGSQAAVQNGNKTPSASQGSAAPYSASAASSSRTLRDNIKQQLANKTDQTASGDLGRILSSDAESSNTLETIASEDLLGTAPAPASKPRDFALGLVDSEKDAAHFMKGPAESSGEADGLLGVDSATLFDRAHQAHRSCLARDCVRL